MLEGSLELELCAAELIWYSGVTASESLRVPGGG